jgi:hypothetical protein
VRFFLALAMLFWSSCIYMHHEMLYRTYMTRHGPEHNMKIRYRVQDDYGAAISHEGGDVFTADIQGFDLDREYGRRDAAEECAEHFWHDKTKLEDGAAYSWPLTFVLLGEGDEELGTLQVDVDARPRFSAIEV